MAARRAGHPGRLRGDRRAHRPVADRRHLPRGPAAEPRDGRVRGGERGRSRGRADRRAAGQLPQLALGVLRQRADRARRRGPGHARVPPESGRQTGRFDLPGAITGTLGVAALVYGLSSAATTTNGVSHWGDTKVLVSLAAAAVLLAAFALIEVRSKYALVPMRVLRSRDRTGAYLISLCMAGRPHPGRSPVRANRPSPTTSRTTTRSASSRSPAAWSPARPAQPPARSARPYPPATRRSRPPAPRPAPRPARRGHASNRHQHPHRSPARETHDPAHTATTATSRTNPGVSRPTRPPHGITDYLPSSHRHADEHAQTSVSEHGDRHSPRPAGGRDGAEAARRRVAQAGRATIRRQNPSSRGRGTEGLCLGPASLHSGTPTRHRARTGNLEGS